MDETKIEFRPAGFGYVNRQAKVVLVGITPGNTQLAGAREGKSESEIKRENAFAGAMRKNLFRMLDRVGVNRLLGIASCVTLWSVDFDKVEMTSLLKDATFYKGKMFNGAATIFKSSKLTQALRDGFAADCCKYECAKLFIGLGDGVGSVLRKLRNENIINADIITIPHPSGANAGRIAVFLGQKDPSYNDAATVRAREMYRSSIRVVRSLCKSVRQSIIC